MKTLGYFLYDFTLNDQFNTGLKFQCEADSETAAYAALKRAYPNYTAVTNVGWTPITTIKQKKLQNGDLLELMGYRLDSEDANFRVIINGKAKFDITPMQLEAVVALATEFQNKALVVTAPGGARTRLDTLRRTTLAYEIEVLNSILGQAERPNGKIVTEQLERIIEKVPVAKNLGYRYFKAWAKRLCENPGNSPSLLVNANRELALQSILPGFESTEEIVKVMCKVEEFFTGEEYVI